MSLARIAVALGICIVVLSTVSLVTSRSAIDRLVSAGALPRAFGNVIPILTIAARVLAVGLTMVGALWVGISAGWLSREWFEQYGMASLLLLLGLFCLAITFRRKN